MRLAAHAWHAAASSEAIHFALSSHAACKNFAGLLVARLVLGICEGSITAGFMIVSSMFYTRKEHTSRVGYWYKDRHQPLSPSFSHSNRFDCGFISFGSLHIHRAVSCQCPRHPTTDTVSSNHVPCIIFGVCFASYIVLLFSVRTNDAMRSFRVIHMMMYMSQGSTRRETVLRSRTPRFMSVLNGKLKKNCC
jgi:hypothetical protein